MFDFIGEILGTILAFFYQVLVPPFSEGWGYGLSIIGLTITINILVFPLTLKQTRSTRAFAAIQPQIKKIQAEYKDDPKEMQRRLMEVQKGAGATPGGCLLPMLVQMPIWFGLFRLLRTPLDFIDPNTALGMALQDDVPEKFLGMLLGTSPSQAMAEGGISTAWPYLMLLALVVATQYVQQWHSTYGQERPSGQPGAGATQAITKIMPLFIGFISYNFPAGLILYWATSNLFRFGQQALIFKLDGRPTTPGNSEELDQQVALENPKDSKPQPGASNKRRRRRKR